MYVDPALRPGSVRLRRVAIIPSRLPATVRDPEKWRRFTWGSLERAFRARGFDVVDYEASVLAAENAGLPLDEARPARDRYADIAQGLGVDLVAVPSFTTSAFTEGVLFITTSHHVSVLTLQLYFTGKSQFGARIEATGDTTYVTGLAFAVGLVAGEVFATISAASCQVPATCNTTYGLMGGIFLGAGTVGDLGYGLALSLGGPDPYWEQSFDDAIRRGLEPFFLAYSPTGGGSPAPPGTAP
jgi:hypothetical protein